MNLATELETALVAVRDASRVCQAVQRRIDVDRLEKDDRSPVTIADYASQALICRALKDAFPNDPIIAEEEACTLRDPSQQAFLERIHAEVVPFAELSTHEDVCSWIDHGNAARYSSRFWTLDPIDGTKGFLRKDQYAVALALVVDGRVVLGLLGCPNLKVPARNSPDGGALFYGVEGVGAFVTSLDGRHPPRSLHVSSLTDPRRARLCESLESGRTAHSTTARVASHLGAPSDWLRMDSQAKYATVARGDADIYLRLSFREGYQECIWDHAGGVGVVEAAGGKVTDAFGKPLDFTQGRRLTANKGVVVTNAQLHAPVIDAIAAVLAADEKAVV